MGSTLCTMILAATKSSSASIDGWSLVSGVIVVAGALLGFGTALVQLRQARVRPATPSTPPDDAAIVSIITAPEAVWSDKDRAAFANAPRGTIFAGLLFMPFGLFQLFSIGGRAGLLLGGSLIIEGCAFLYVGSVQLTLIRGKQPGDAIVSCRTDLTMSGTHAAVLARALRAMNSLGAIRATGTYVASDDHSVTRLVGGTGTWPRNHMGQRLTITIESHGDSTWRIQIESCSFKPQLRLRVRNDDNVRRLVEQFVA